MQAKDFCHTKHGWVYQAVADLQAQHEPADYVTICDLLARRGQLDDISGHAEITRLITRCPTSVHAEHYASIVKRFAFRRRLIEASGEIAELAYEHEGSLDELQQQASQVLNAALMVTTPDSHLYGTDEALIEYEAGQIARAERLEADPYLFVTTGWRDLDYLVVSVERGMVHVVASRPGVGKTIYLECVAEHNARRGKAVAFYHLELSHQTMLDRRMARYSGIDFRELVRGYHGSEIRRAEGVE